MGRGFLAGVFWGGIVGLALLVVSSQTLDRQQLSFPQPDASPVEVPGGSEFNQARVETDPVVPEPETRPEAEAASGVTAPEDAIDQPPAFDTSALEVPTPSVESPSGLGAMPQTPQDAPEPPAISDSEQPGQAGEALVVPEAPGQSPGTDVETPLAVDAPDVAGDEGPNLEAGTDTSVETDVAALPQVAAEAPSAANASTAPQVSTDATAPVAPVSPEIGTESSLPGAGERPATPSLPQISGEPFQPSSEPETPVQPEAPDTPESGAARVTVDGSSESFFEPVDSLEDRAEGVDTDRLPQIGSATSGLPRIGDSEDTVEEPSAPTTDAIEAAPSDGPALLVYRSAFENPMGDPLVSVILIQEGDVLSADKLQGLPEHVAFAIDAAEADAGEKAAYYRAAGREVVLIPSLPQGARPQDVEQALRVNFQTVPEAVAVMDVSGGRFQTDRAAVSQVVDVVADTGHGLITFPRGLNTVHQRAEKAGVATGLIFRNLDGSGESAEQIRRTMDRAAFRARQSDAVILVGTTAPKTLGAIVEWSLGNRSSSVTIAPISAALLDG